MEYIKSSVLSAAHGFFGRAGGVSEGIFASLNCGYGSGDDKALVRENRARVAAQFGAAELLTLYQIHSAEVVSLRAAWEPGHQVQADALVTRMPGLPLGILAADCAPVLMGDAESRVIGAAHAGWKGASGGVLEATIKAMEALGAVRGRISAAIGPCIAQASYEVGPEFIARLVAQDAANARFFADSHFDLKAYAAHRLRQAGVREVDVLPHDTCADEAHFFSYRRATLRKEAGYGRQISVIILD